MLYDVFISHASEDKADFVRGLADALRENNIAVSYDEFSLRTGDSLRRSIDHGLSKSRFGVVVLSKAFIGKGWSEWELDGLIPKQNHRNQSVLLPIWLGVSYGEVLDFAPPLADNFAILAEKGSSYVVKELLNVLKPPSSSLVVARDRLIEIGFNAPIVTDDWWHKAIKFCGSNQLEGSLQNLMGFGHWGVPLPNAGETTAEKGERIAWAALQLNWQRISKENKISQITHPEIILKFIAETPGLRQACLAYPQYLATYAPQLTIPGFGGEFEEIFNKWLDHSLKDQKKKREKKEDIGTGLTIGGKVQSCDKTIALHEESFGNYEPETIACNFVQGHLMGAVAKVYDTIDYFLWLLSESSVWLPDRVRTFLIDGMKKWSAWPWDVYCNESTFPINSNTGAFIDSLYKTRTMQTYKLTEKVFMDIESRFAFSINILDLPETVEELKTKFFESGSIEEWFKKRNINKIE